MKELKPIDENWKFRVFSLDGSGYKPARDLPPVKRTYKNRPWKYCVVIVKFWDEDTGEEGYDRCIFLYDYFSVSHWVEKMNMNDWIYNFSWKVEYDFVTDDATEVSRVVREYLSYTRNE